jgi:hypothetical protein
VNWKNPFRMVSTPDGDVYEAMQPTGPGIADFENHEVHTLIAIHHIDGPADLMVDEPGHLDGTTIAKLPGLWAPPPGTPIQVTEPNREVVVTGIRYQVEPLGFAAIVYVSDSQGG